MTYAEYAKLSRAINTFRAGISKEFPWADIAMNRKTITIIDCRKHTWPDPKWKSDKKSPNHLNAVCAEDRLPRFPRGKKRKKVVR